MVDENAGKSFGGLGDAMCSVCEMTVVWMQNQLRQNQTKERIMNYINEVKKKKKIPYLQEFYRSFRTLINFSAAM